MQRKKNREEKGDDDLNSGDDGLADDAGLGLPSSQAY